MKINTNENIVHFDVDETLILHNINKYPNFSRIDVDYYGHQKQVAVHEEHVLLLKSYKTRGFYIRVWSNNGYKWASHIIMQLGLAAYVDEVETKSSKYVDDLEAKDILGQRVYLPPSE